MNAFVALLARELRRFVRRPSQVVSTVATPVVIWVFLAAGFAGAVGAGPDAGAGAGLGAGAGFGAGVGDSYAALLAPGIAILIVLFATVFAGMSLIEDRHEGFLQGVLVSPAPRWAVAGSKLTAAALIAAAQGVPILAVAPLVAGVGSAGGVVLATVMLLLTAFGIGGLGLALAWWVDSGRGFHGLFTVALMPLWILSGAVFPEDTASRWITLLADLNPVGWCRAATDAALRGEPAIWPTLGAAAFAAAGTLAATAAIGGRARR